MLDASNLKTGWLQVFHDLPLLTCSLSILLGAWMKGMVAVSGIVLHRSWLRAQAHKVQQATPVTAIAALAVADRMAAG